MNSIYEKIHQQIKKAVADAQPVPTKHPQVELPRFRWSSQGRGFGDFSTNIVMQVADR